MMVPVGQTHTHTYMIQRLPDVRSRTSGVTMKQIKRRRVTLDIRGSTERKRQWYSAANIQLSYCFWSERIIARKKTKQQDTFQHKNKANLKENTLQHSNENKSSASKTCTCAFRARQMKPLSALWAANRRGQEKLWDKLKRIVIQFLSSSIFVYPRNSSETVCPLANTVTLWW